MQHKLGLLRDVTTTTQMFRQLVNELTLLLTYEATKGLADEEVEIETPLERTAARRISGKKVAVCPILRAGVGMLDAVLSLVPGARVGFIGLYRNEETLQPVEYYVKLPDDLTDRDVILLDPMLATGNSTAAAVETVKRAGATSVRLIALIAAPEGIERIHRDHPDVSIVVASIDRRAQREGVHRAGPRRRRRPPVRNEVAAMWSDLRANPEVVWGALIAFAIVVLLTPAVGGMARLLGVVDRPGERRLNKRPIPRLGGLAIFLGILVPSLAFLSLDGEMRGIVLGAAVACVVGAVDDFRGLDPLPKLAGQIAAASIPLAFGVWIDHFTFPFIGVVDLSPWVGMPLTVVWIVAVMNMVNFLDGMDGLAAGVCAIAGLTFAILALSLGKVDAALLSAVVAGACIGFLRHNFFPARIFMGDSGALVLGFTLATVSISGLLKTASTVVLFLPLLVLAVPIIDTSFVVAKRVKYRQPISSPDRSHLHHRFMNIGFSQRRAAVTMWAWTACLGAAALATRFIPFREGGRVAPRGDDRRDRDRARRARILGLHRVPARDRQAREPARPAAAGGVGGHGAAQRVSTLQGGTVTFVFTRHRRLDRAAQAARRPVRRRARGSPPHRPRGVPRAWGRGGRHAGRRVLLLLRPREGRGRGRRRGPAGAREP